MADRKLYPSFVQLRYATTWGQHVQTIPMNQWSGAGLGDPGTVLNWGGNPIAVDTMVEALVDAITAYLPASTTYIDYNVFNMPTPESIPQPVFSKSLSQAGSAVGLTGQAQAVLWWMTIRSTNFGRLNFLLLDRPNNNVWGNVFTPDAGAQAIIDELVSEDNGWRARDNGKPHSFMDITISFSKELRRKYGMI